MEELLLRIWNVLEKIIVRDVFLLVLIMVIIIAALWDVTSDYDRKWGIVDGIYNIYKSLYNLMKFNFMFVLGFLINITLLLGLLDYNIEGCLITKYILCLNFFVWSSLLFLVDYVFHNFYFKFGKQNQTYVRIWISVKLIITMIFFIFFGYILVSDVYSLFV